MKKNFNGKKDFSAGGKFTYYVELEQKHQKKIKQKMLENLDVDKAVQKLLDIIGE